MSLDTLKQAIRDWSGGDKNSKVGRLAMRVEDDFYVAYYALPDTLEGAIELGRVHLKFIEGHKNRQMQFIELMKGCLADVMQETLGAKPTWPEGVQPALERRK